MTPPTIADQIIATLRRAGAQRLFGMPGGGSNADLIEAAVRAGMPFTMAHTEAASAFMAAAQAELTGRPGACIATLGPGAASLMNGVAQARLDRTPLFVLTDCIDDPVMQHQNLPQGAMVRSVAKWSASLERGRCSALLREALCAATSLPGGPVHLDLSSAVACAPAEEDLPACPPRSEPIADLEAAREILRRCRRPVFLLGLGARNVASAVRAACERSGIPALVTYKAKGVVPDRHRWFGGILTNGALERAILDRADAFVAVGLDPVELLPRPWSYRQPLISINAWPLDQQHLPITVELAGDVPALLGGLDLTGEWDPAEVARLSEEQRVRMRPAQFITAESRSRGGNLKPPEATKDAEIGERNLLPHRVVELAAEVYPGAQVTVDAGAHMFPVMALWPAEAACGVLISNGLATMGFGLPAGIGACLLDRTRPVVVFTGDGGLLMCTGELSTAARERLPLRIILFDDASLSLIKVKQVQRSYHTEGVSIGPIDWVRVAEGMGVRGVRAGDEASLAACLRDTAEHPGPVLIAARIAAEAYEPTIRALRGGS